MTLETLMAAYRRSDSALTGPELEAAAETAWRVLQDRTMGRLAAYTGDHEETICRCFCQLTDLVHQRETGTELTAQTVGDWSQSYRDGSGGATNEQLYTALIRQWLWPTGLLSRGWPVC